MNETRNAKVTRPAVPELDVAAVRIDAEPAAECRWCGHWLAPVPGSRFSDDYAHTIVTDETLGEPYCDSPEPITCDAGCTDVPPLGDTTCLTHSGWAGWED